ncbi:hypothetical protein [Halorubrum sp. DTA46]|uniref:hypothetical protein n=1 Tax=Halorubrum sp. DTA46 TaxID=3402162 RepID=UPI003AAD8177
MSFLLELLRQIGLGGSALAAASCVLVAFYLMRARRVGHRAASAGAALVAYSVAVLVVLAAGIAANWFDPNPSVIVDHLHLALRELVEKATGPGRRLLRWLVDAVAS